MKMLLAAIAIAIASPAVAQTETPPDAHAPHSDQAGATDHSARTDHAQGHEDHDMAGGCCEKDADGKMACCEKMKAEGKTMACCEQAVAETPGADPHAGHSMSQD